MTSRDVFKAAKENNIKELFRAIKEPHQTYSAEYASGMMYINDIKIIDDILNEANKILENALKMSECNVNVRRMAYSLLKKTSISVPDNYVYWDMEYWKGVLYQELCKRYFTVRSIRDVDIHGIYEEAKLQRIRTIISQAGAKNILNKIYMETERIELDTDNIACLMNAHREIQRSGEEGLGTIKDLIEEHLENKLLISDEINRNYFVRVYEMNRVLENYFRKGK